MHALAPMPTHNAYMRVRITRLREYAPVRLPMCAPTRA